MMIRVIVRKIIIMRRIMITSTTTATVIITIIVKSSIFKKAFPPFQWFPVFFLNQIEYLQLHDIMY